MPTPDPIQTLDENDALAFGYRQLTYALDPTLEQWMIDNIVADMRRGSIPCVLVRAEAGVEVWRKPRCTV